RENDQCRLEALAVELLAETGDGPPRAGQVDRTHLVATIAEQRGGQRERVRRLRRAKDFLALLAAPLAREGQVADERRVDEKGPGAKHHSDIRRSRRRRPAAPRSVREPAPRPAASARPCSSAGRPERYHSRPAGAGARRTGRSSTPLRATAASGRPLRSG